MANHKSAEKRARQNLKRRMRNKSVRSRIRHLTKVVHSAAGEKSKEAYRVVDDKNETERNKRVAIGRASRRIAERAWNRLTDDF